MAPSQFACILIVQYSLADFDQEIINSCLNLEQHNAVSNRVSDSARGKPFVSTSGIALFDFTLPEHGTKFGCISYPMTGECSQNLQVDRHRLWAETTLCPKRAP
ncbi:hypothetical protein PGQ11_008624 [Apiospora arundinis]|uniref:Uncharacterized protein n=1 Tax=Apiospora arundinis TaxID=335852 RepID=A0ABR2IGH3_9PEZI